MAVPSQMEAGTAQASPAQAPPAGAVALAGGDALATGPARAAGSTAGSVLGAVGGAGEAAGAPGASQAGGQAGGGSTGSRGEEGRQGAPALAVPASGSGSSQAGVAGAAEMATSVVVAPAALPTNPTVAESPVLGAGVGMQNMIDAIRATIDLAARQGLTQARIALQPAELGEIRIHLAQSADGLTARVTAGTPAAAQALAQGRAELHESLSSLGVSLLRLDVGAFGQSQTGGREGGFARADAQSAAPASTSSEEGEGDEALGPLDPVPASAGSAAGRLVDVLA